MQSTEPARPKLRWLTVFLLSGLLASGLDLPLFDLDEGAFSEATREMLANRDFLFITLEGEPRPDKPILFYWLQAASVSLLGMDNRVWRLPSVIAAMVWLWAVWQFARQRMQEKLALQAAVLTLTTAGVGIISHAATADALFNLWLTLTAFDMARYFETGQRAYARRTWLWMGLGFLTKGPAALVLPALPALWHALREGQMRLLWQALRLPSGWVLFLVTALPWYVLVAWLHGPQLLVDFFLEHNLGRFTRTMEGHGGFPAYYLLALPLVLLPYSGLLVEIHAQRKTLLQQPWARFGLRWLVVSFVLFSLSSTQLPHYILYGLPLLFPMLAWLGSQHHWRHTGLALAIPVLLAAFWLVLALASPGIVADLAPCSLEALLFSTDPQALFRLWPWALGLLVVLTATVLILKQQPLLALCASGVLHLLFLQQAILPTVARLQQQPIQAMAQATRDLPVTIVSWKLYMPSFSVYRQQITPRRMPRDGEWLLTRKDRFASMCENQNPPQGWQVVMEQGPYVLLRPVEAEQP